MQAIPPTNPRTAPGKRAIPSAVGASGSGRDIEVGSKPVSGASTGDLKDELWQG
jgi:hypothetical protein